MADDWQSPTSFVDPSTKWTNEVKAYDENTGPAYVATTLEPGYYLELHRAALNCDKVRVWAIAYADWPAETNPNITLDVYYDSDWHNIFTGAITKNTWVEKSIPAGTKSVTAMRLKENNAADGIDWFEADFNQVAGVTEKTGSDTGSGADAKVSGNPLATLSKSDTGSGAEGTPTQAANLTGTETGSGIEALVAFLAIFIASETGSGVDVVAELAQLTLKTGSDSGSGVESLVTRLLATSETGTGLESLLTRLLHHTDSGLGSDTRLTLLAALARAESGSGLDAFTGLTSALTTAEAGSGIDELLGREITLLDAGSGLDIAILYKAFFSTDSGAGFEALVSLLALTVTSEVGSGSEHLRAKIMTSPAAGDMKLPTKKGKAGIPSKGVNL